MLTPKPDPIFVRASVASKCNMTCVYCPKLEGMENRVPSHLAGQLLTTAQYIRNLEHVARNGILGISFTGGEPTLNPDLPELVKAARSMFERVELTSNGFRLAPMLPALVPNLDILKVSLDTVDPILGSRVTQSRPEDTERAMDAISEACALGMTVGINVVLMRSMISEIRGIVDFCRRLNACGLPGRAYVSLLDFYYSPERRETWEAEFIPIEFIASMFERLYRLRTPQPRFGCTFYWIDAGGVEVRFKDSLGATHRAPKCHKCQQYCQEGVYGLKHSVEGWVTTCPTGDATFGVHLAPGLTTEEADRRLDSFIQDIRLARPDQRSFATLLETHILRPSATSASPLPMIDELHYCERTAGDENQSVRPPTSGDHKAAGQ